MQKTYCNLHAVSRPTVTLLHSMAHNAISPITLKYFSLCYENKYTPKVLRFVYKCLQTNTNLQTNLLYPTIHIFYGTATSVAEKKPSPAVAFVPRPPL